MPHFSSPVVTIGVCTRQRPEMLCQCLESLLGQEISIPGLASRVNIVVVENDLAPHAKSLVEKLGNNSPLPIFYHLETDIGIAQARNRILEEALALGSDWLWFLDDDEVADRSCLTNLLQMAHSSQADVVHGRIVHRYPPSAQWASFSRNPRDEGEDGKNIRSAATNNVLVSSRLFASTDMALRFDAHLRFSGGEDTLLFKQAFRQGARIVFSASATVCETLTESRCTLSAIFDRQARIIASGVYIDRKIHGKQMADQKHWRRFRQNLLQLSVALVVFPWVVFWNLLLFRSQNIRKDFLLVWLKLATLCGRFRGLRGQLYHSYALIHGN